MLKISLQTEIFHCLQCSLSCPNFQELKQSKNNLAKLDVNVFGRWVRVRLSIFNVLLKMTFLMLRLIASQLFRFWDFSFNNMLKISLQTEIFHCLQHPLSCPNFPELNLSKQSREIRCLCFWQMSDSTFVYFLCFVENDLLMLHSFISELFCFSDFSINNKLKISLQTEILQTVGCIHKISSL